MYNKAHLIAAIIINTVIVLVITHLATGSLNPLEAFKGDSLLLKIVVGFFMFAVVMCFVNILFAQSLAGVKCGKCGLPLLDYVSSHGKPLKCRLCSRYYHTLCVRADGGGAIQGCKQAGCPSAPAPY